MSAVNPWPQTSCPIVAAPMAGGSSGVDLVVAVGDAGGLGMLAAGYKSAAEVLDQIASVRARTEAGFGVNVFVPADESCAPERVPSAEADTGVADAQGRERADRVAVESYRELLAVEAERRGVSLPAPDWQDRDHYEDKIDVLEAAALPCVSFTFGCPSGDVVDRLHAVGTSVAVTVTTTQEAEGAVKRGADALVVQGFEAGGHRSTHRVTDVPNELDHLALLPMIAQAAPGVPLLAAGGITTAGDTRRALGAGAVAVVAGTAFLLADEAGTSAAHRMGLTNTRLSPCVTRAFSGRPARGLRNGFVDRFDAYAPAVFPVVDQLTKPLRAAAAREGDLDGVSLWAGAGWRAAREAPAADILAALAP
ncbi:MAG: nitronate monooxygenase [Mobilicoccus sp.]|nr:nitronate monooxygenase [Mobilicoccus sp.]